MTDIEQRLRRDLKEVTERVAPGSIRPLRAPAPGGEPWPCAGWPRSPPWSPVIGVVAGVSLVGRVQANCPHRPPLPSPSGTMPRYYVNVVPDLCRGVAAARRDARCGARLGHRHGAGHGAVPTLTDAQGGTEGPSIHRGGRRPDVRDHRNRPRAAGPAAANGLPNARNVTRFYLLRVAANGRSASLSALSATVPDTSPWTTWRCPRTAASSPWRRSPARTRPLRLHRDPGDHAGDRRDR